MSNLVLYGQIKSLVNINDNPAYASFDPIEKVLYVAEQGARAARSIYSSLKGNPNAEYTIDDLSEAMEKFYEDYLEPIDLPMNDFVEGIVDRNVPNFFKPVLIQAQAKLKDWQAKK
jgi:hypothetical protein